jgi:hypothetical protein
LLLLLGLLHPLLNRLLEGLLLLLGLTGEVGTRGVGHGYGGVPKELLDELGVGALREQQRSVVDPLRAYYREVFGQA